MGFGHGKLKFLDLPKHTQGVCLQARCEQGALEMGLFEFLNEKIHFKNATKKGVWLLWPNKK